MKACRRGRLLLVLVFVPAVQAWAQQPLYLARQPVHAAAAGHVPAAYAMPPVHAPGPQQGPSLEPSEDLARRLAQLEANVASLRQHYSLAQSGPLLGAPQQPAQPHEPLPAQPPMAPIMQPPGSIARQPAAAVAKEPAEKKRESFPTVKLTGFMHVDAGYYDQDELSKQTLGDIQNGVGFRRARLQAVGKVAEFTGYSIEFDFATAGRPSFMDIWLEQQNLPLLGAVRIGHFRQPISMDSLTPVRQLTFLERSLPFQAFDTFRRVGIMAYDTSESQLTSWQNSIYKTGGFNNGPLGDSRFATDIGDRGGYSYATRITHLPYYDEPAEGRYLLHLGASFNHSSNTENDYDGSTPFYQARSIPEFFVGDPAAGGAVAAGTPFFVDTGRIPSDNFQVYNLELAGQFGSVHVQSEYFMTTVDQSEGSNLFYDGAYVQTGWFLTGEHRTYNRTFGVFDKVIPHEEFFTLGKRGFCGWGAWELAARLSHLNLQDPQAMPLPGFPAFPGRLTDATLGLNWYWNAYTKLQFNWIHCWLDNATLGASQTDIYAARAHLEF